MHPLSHLKFENPLTSDPSSTINRIENIIENNFLDIDCFLIKSTQGNGGTHLLGSIFNKLKSIDQKLIYYSGEQLGKLFTANPTKSLENHLLQYDYIFIDDFGYFNYITIPKFQQWFQKFYDVLISKNKTLLLTFTENSITDIEIPSFLKKGRVTSIISDFPTGKEFEIVSAVFKSQKGIVGENIIKHLSSQKASSVRLIQNICITIIAKSKWNSINLEKIELKNFKKLYQKDLLYFSTMSRT